MPFFRASPIPGTEPSYHEPSAERELSKADLLFRYDFPRSSRGDRSLLGRYGREPDLVLGDKLRCGETRVFGVNVIPPPLRTLLLLR